MDRTEYDVLVVGGGITGQEAALNLANMNFKVLLVEKDMSIGGKMVQLSKVFPTLDCAACITTPKMSETARHPNITIMTYSEVLEIVKNDKSFAIKVLKNPRYVKEDVCTGCQDCEFACPVIIEDQYNYGLAARKTAYIPFNLASPRIALIERNDVSAPCINKCPGGVKAYGYVSLVRNGLYEEAMNLHLEDIPLPGSLGRTCYAPCEGECTRKEVDGSVSIRRIKRFFSDYYYNKYPEPKSVTIENNSGKKIAIIGSGPSGLTAAYHLAKKGHKVKIFEAESELGGMLKTTIPSFRLPNEIVNRDIKNITSMGVEYELNKRIENLKDLKAKGFDAIYISAGTHETVKFDFEGKDLSGVLCCLSFLKQVNGGDRPDLSGKTVMVFGGGNVAMDSARTALRLNAEKVVIIYRRSREQMPALDIEIQETEREGIEFQYLKNPVEFIGEEGKLSAVKCINMKLGKPDESGRKRPVPIENSEHIVKADIAIVSIGLLPSSGPFKDVLELNKNGTINVNSETLQTSTPYIFAGGDVVTGASSIIMAAGQGKRAAFFIDKYLNNENLSEYEFDHRLPPASKDEVLAKMENLQTVLPVIAYERPAKERIKDFEEIESAYTEEEAIQSASRCLNCGICRECHQCAVACPADAIDFTQRKEVISSNVKSVILASGFNLFPPECKIEYGYNKYKNVIHAMEMDRLLAPTRPFHDVLRPLDGKKPDNIAYVLCTGSRDRSLNNPVCSQICCMYSIKQAQLLMGALPMADITIYYIDIRAFGKGFDEFYEQAKGMGVLFVKGKVAKITEKENGSGNLILRYEDIETGTVSEAEHDLVVLSVGILPNNKMTELFKNKKLVLDDYNYVKQIDELLSPAKTSIEGVFIAGAASGPLDIPDSILSAGNASAEAASYIRRK
jgi:heterodisulfide reductase subunit A-like polyferredoxin